MTFLRSSRIPARLCAGSRGRLPKQPWEQSRSVQILVLFRKTDFSFNFSNKLSGRFAQHQIGTEENALAHPCRVIRLLVQLLQQKFDR